MAMSVPVVVSPIFMFEVSVAATVVGVWLGFRRMGCGFSMSVFAILYGCVGVVACVSVWRLSCMRRWGSVVSVVGCGKLYFCVIVIVCC